MSWEATDMILPGRDADMWLAYINLVNARNSLSGPEKSHEPDPKQSEWVYHYTERLGILCGVDKPTDEQDAMARKDADAAVARMREVDLPIGY